MTRAVDRAHFRFRGWCGPESDNRILYLVARSGVLILVARNGGHAEEDLTGSVVSDHACWDRFGGAFVFVRRRSPSGLLRCSRRLRKEGWMSEGLRAHAPLRRNIVLGTRGTAGSVLDAPGTAAELS